MCDNEYISLIKRVSFYLGRTVYYSKNDQTCKKNNIWCFCLAMYNVLISAHIFIAHSDLRRIHTESDTTPRHDIYAISCLWLANKLLCARNALNILRTELLIGQWQTRHCVNVVSWCRVGCSVNPALRGFSGRCDRRILTHSERRF